MIPPAEWYAQQDRTKHYMRRTNRPFEEGVSRGALRSIGTCNDAQLGFFPEEFYKCYAVVADNRMRKGRKYGIGLRDWLDLYGSGEGMCFAAISPTCIPYAAALCVRVAPRVLYVSGWGDIAGVDNLSPVTFLCKGLYQWCRQNGFETLDIGIAGDDPGLAEFKRRLGFAAVAQQAERGHCKSEVGGSIPSGGPHA